MFPETSHQTMSDLQFEFSRDLQPGIVRSYQTMSGSTGQCPPDSFTLKFVHYFGHILLTKCPFDPILLPLAS
jgi:hypothetical protein